MYLPNFKTYRKLNFVIFFLLWSAAFPSFSLPTNRPHSFGNLPFEAHSFVKSSYLGSTVVDVGWTRKHSSRMRTARLPTIHASWWTSLKGEGVPVQWAPSWTSLNMSGAPSTEAGMARAQSLYGGGGHGQGKVPVQGAWPGENPCTGCWGSWVPVWWGPMHHN